MTLAEKRQHKYTYSDYEKWEDSEEWEIIGSVAYARAPIPNVKHQEVSSKTNR